MNADLTPLPDRLDSPPGVCRERYSIVLFDGTCNLCHGAVSFILDRDRRKRFRFASLQSAAGRCLWEQAGLPSDGSDTMALIEDGRTFTRSTAALRIARQLTWPWPLVYALIAVPRFLRDGLYRWLASQRHRWLGKSDHCRVPRPELQDRFLDA
jgi:predicted DCC family thiol-disulfide oxidoreductase YuxK